MNPMVVRDGHLIDLDAPLTSDIAVSDIAHALAGKERYNGHAGDYTVCDHVCLAAILAALILTCEPEAAGPLVPAAKAVRAVHQHDSGEAYYGDGTRPVLRYCGADHKALVRRVDLRIAEKFDLVDCPEFVRRVDLLMLEAEKRCFFPGTSDWETSHVVAGDPFLDEAQRLVFRLAEDPPDRADRFSWFLEVENILVDAEAAAPRAAVLLVRLLTV